MCPLFKGRRYNDNVARVMISARLREQKIMTATLQTRRNLAESYDGKFGKGCNGNEVLYACAQKAVRILPG